jgi:hypothetical protein
MYGFFIFILEELESNINWFFLLHALFNLYNINTISTEKHDIYYSLQKVCRNNSLIWNQKLIITLSTS